MRQAKIKIWDFLYERFQNNYGNSELQFLLLYDYIFTYLLYVKETKLFFYILNEDSIVEDK